MLPLAETKASAAYKEIRSQILNGSLEPGSTVNQEVLAASLGLSTTPIREALRMLDAEGLVALKPHKDAVVASLTLRELTEVLALRLELDPFAASLAAEVASAAERDIVVRLAEAGSPSSPQEQLAANRLFSSDDLCCLWEPAAHTDPRLPLGPNRSLSTGRPTRPPAPGAARARAS
jgi:DNA-binding GntR family transcriptional regulator